MRFMWNKSAKWGILLDMKISRFALPLLALSFLLFSGCATSYQVRLDGLSAPESRETGRSYVLTSRTEGVSEDDLFFKEVARHLHPVLKEAGFRQAPDAASANLKIRVDAHLSEPLVETRSYSEPVYYERPGYSHVVRIPVLGKDGKVLRYAYREYWSPPRTRFAGYIDRDEQRTVYDKILHLSARSLDGEGKTGAELWSLRIALRGTSTDYRSALPVMLVAAEPYIGERTDGEQTVTIKEDNPDLQAYRQLVSDGR